MAAINQRRVSIERMAEIWRYRPGHPTDLTAGDFEGLRFHARTFGEFLEINRDVVQLYEGAV